MKRSRFINILLTGGFIGWLGSVLYPVFSFLKPPKVPEANVMSVKAGKPGDIPLNSGKIVKFGRKPVILIHQENGGFITSEVPIFESPRIRRSGCGRDRYQLPDLCRQKVSCVYQQAFLCLPVSSPRVPACRISLTQHDPVF